MSTNEQARYTAEHVEQIAAYRHREGCHTSGDMLDAYAATLRQSDAPAGVVSGARVELAARAFSDAAERDGFEVSGDNLHVPWIRAAIEAALSAPDPAVDVVACDNCGSVTECPCAMVGTGSGTTRDTPGPAAQGEVACGYRAKNNPNCFMGPAAVAAQKAMGWDVSTDPAWVPVYTAPPAQPAERVPEDDRYYLQDRRSYVGNCPMWWAKNGKGYVTRLDEAHRFTREEAMKQHRMRSTDVPWPCSEIDALCRLTVDIQHMRPVDEQVAALAASSPARGGGGEG